MDYLILTTVFVNLILLVFFYFNFRKKQNEHYQILLEELDIRMSEFPDLISLKIRDFLKDNFLEMNERIAKNNQLISDKIYEFQNSINETTNAKIKDLSQDFSELQLLIQKTLSRGTESISSNLHRELGDFRDQFTKNLSHDFEKLVNKIETNLDKIDNKVQENLSQGFEKSNKTFTSLIERLAKIDEAQKNIESLSSNIISLQDILSDKKTRGVFGEVQLKNILASVFGDNNDKVYQLQHKFKENGLIADAVVFAPEPMGSLVIDSKFPLENYQRMNDKSLSDAERLLYSKQFVSNVKKHIDDISTKYIIMGVTAESAILFLPAEAIFAQINAEFPQLIEYAHKKNIYITSPTTLMATMSTLQIILYNYERSKYASIIQNELEKLSIEFTRFKSRWSDLNKHIDTIQKDAKNLNVTGDKISKSFDRISKVEIDRSKILESEV